MTLSQTRRLLFEVLTVYFLMPFLTRYAGRVRGGGPTYSFFPGRCTAWSICPSGVEWCAVRVCTEFWLASAAGAGWFIGPRTRTWLRSGWCFGLCVSDLYTNRFFSGILIFIQIRMKKHRWHKRILKNSDPLIFSLGWRRFQSLPVYSLEVWTSF